MSVFDYTQIMNVNLKTKVIAIIVAFGLVLGLGACSPTDKGVRHFPSSQHANAKCIVKHESGGDPNARSITNDHGLFQINAVHAADFRRVTGKSFYNGVYDPSANGQYARWLWNKQGWRPWTTRKKCGL